MKLEVTEAELDYISSLEGLKKRKAMKAVIERYKSELETKRTPDAEITTLVAEAGKELKRQVGIHTVEYEGKDGQTKTRNVSIPQRPAAKESVGYRMEMRKLTAMNLYNNGNKLDARDIMETRLTGKIEVRNPKPENLEGYDKLYESNEIFRSNYDKIKQSVENETEETEYVDLNSKFPINKFLGSVDVSKKNTRIEVYNYWKGISELYVPFYDSVVKFLAAIKELDFEGELGDSFEKLNKRITNTNLEYIVEFPGVEEKFLEPRHRFFNIITRRMALEGLLQHEEGSGNYKDDEFSASDVNQQMMQEMVGEVKSTSDWNDDIDMAVGDADQGTEFEWENDVRTIMGGADPLLIYESNRGNKLLAISQEAETSLIELLESIIEQIDDGNGVTLDNTTNVERWIDEVENTTILDEGDVEGFFLPISCLSNSSFKQMFAGAEFESAQAGKIGAGKDKIDLDVIDDIKEFFNDLYEILSSSAFRFAVEFRTSAGRTRGSTVDSYEARGTSMEQLRGAAQVPISLNRRGQIRDNFNEMKSELQDMMEGAIKYYFDPLYSGMLPIEVPNFSSSIGARVLQTLSLDLGLETVMSSSYDALSQGSVEEVEEGDLRQIAEFLELIFVPDIELTQSLIDNGEEAALALTEIFGKEEANENYCAALIHHFMVDTNELKLENSDFSGKSVKERAEQFDAMFKSRKAFPVFALPHWLDMNQGILTNKSPAMKQQYNRLKDIFESVQTDLPVLLHKMLKAHDAIREELGKEVIYGYIPFNEYGIEKMITKMQIEEDIDLSNLEVEHIIKTVDSHQNISKEYGISGEQVYKIKAHFR